MPALQPGKQGGPTRVEADQIWCSLRNLTMEIFAKETVSLGAPLNPNHIVKQIDKVSIEDVKRMAKKLLESDPAVAVLGPTTDVESLLISARERQSSKLVICVYLDNFKG